MNLPAGDLTLRGPGIECPWFDSQLFSEFFDRQQHTDTHRGSLPTPIPLLRSRQHASVSLVAAPVPPRIEPASLQPSRPARCQLAPSRDSDSSLPRTVVGGREPLSLSDEGLQLVFVQVHPTLPVELPAPSPSNSAPWPSAREAAPTPSRRTGAQLLQKPSRLIRRGRHPSPPGECSSFASPAFAGDPSKDSCTSGTGASELGFEATNDARSGDTGAHEGCSYARDPLRSGPATTSGVLLGAWVVIVTVCLFMGTVQVSLRLLCDTRPRFTSRGFLPVRLAPDWAARPISRAQVWP